MAITHVRVRAASVLRAAFLGRETVTATAETSMTAINIKNRQKRLYTCASWNEIGPNLKINAPNVVAVGA